MARRLPRIPARRLIPAGLLILAVAAPAAAAPRFRLSQATSFAAPPPDSAVLYLVREQFARTRPLSPEELYLDDAPLALLPQHTFVEATVAPGPHRLWGEAGMSDQWLDCRPGRRYLLRLRETIGDLDELHLEWMFDEPDRIETLVSGVPLERAITTAKGMRSLKARPRARDAASRPAPEELPLVLENMWFEDPLRPETRKASFRRERVRVTVDSSRVLVTAAEYAVAIPCAEISAVRFGGVRDSGNQPWLEVEYRAGGQPHLAWLADPEPAAATRTYNRLFTLIRELWQSPGGAAGSRP